LLPDQEVSYVFRGSMCPKAGIQMDVNVQDGQFTAAPSLTGNIPATIQ
jgi:hypothetical protein